MLVNGSMISQCNVASLTSQSLIQIGNRVMYFLLPSATPNSTANSNSNANSASHSSEPSLSSTRGDENSEEHNKEIAPRSLVVPSSRLHDMTTVRQWQKNTREPFM
jgi:hypothetical protein